MSALLVLLTGCGGGGGGGSASGGSDGSSPQPSSATASSGATGPASSSTPSASSAQTDDHGAPGSPDAHGRQSDVLARVKGNANGSCQRVAGRRDTRSGGFVAGPFDQATSSYGTKRSGFARTEVRLYWIPEHARHLPGLTVTATSGGRQVRLHQRVVSDAEQWKFYDSRLRLPAGGTWTLRAASGPDRGCFLMTLPQR